MAMERSVALGLLEESLGMAASPLRGSSEAFDGSIDGDDDSTPTRPLLHYGYHVDPLFADSPAAVADASSPAVEGGGGGAGGRGAAVERGLGEKGSSEALIAYLQHMAATLEVQSGEEESEIRGKIAHLQHLLDGRPAMVAEQLARLDGSACAGVEEQPKDEQAESVLQQSMHQIERGMCNVDSLLRSDPEAAQLLASAAHVWMPALALDVAEGTASPTG
ncbi:MAG: hypothetical protein SGPRY_001258 [Prymnesium sp.]